MIHRTLLCMALLLAGCDGCGAEPSDAVPPPAAPEPAATPAPDTPAPDEPEPDPAVAKAAVVKRLLGTQQLDGWTLRLAYDLDSMLLASWDRPGDATSVTVLGLRPEGAEFDAEALKAAFAGATPTRHPLEVLGYDHIQPASHGQLALGDRQLPSLTFSWLRVDLDEGSRESGRADAVWLRCDEPLLDGRFVLLAVERDQPEERPDALEEFAQDLRVCGP